MPLKWEEKAFVKQVHEVAFERTRIKEVFKAYFLLEDKREDILKANGRDYEAAEARESGRVINDYYETELSPIFPIVSHHVCAYQDGEVFSALMEFILANPGSASEELSDILGEIYICRPDFMIVYANEHQEYQLIMDHIDFGFLNATYNDRDRPEFLVLKARLDSLNTSRPFRNY